MTTTSLAYYPEAALYHGNIPHVMGTRFNMLFVCHDEATARSYWTDATAVLERLERMLNRFDPESETAAMNRRIAAGKPSPASQEMAHILRLCREYHERTLGLFDITLADLSQLELSPEGMVTPRREGLSVDFGGFAKGYALEQLRQAARRAGIGHAFIDFGNSSIAGMGHHPYGDCWKVSFPDPYSGRVLEEFELRDESLSTSGNTPGYTGHIVTPRTGTPNRERKACTVVARNALDAEVLSTVWMIADTRQQKLISEDFNHIIANTYLL